MKWVLASLFVMATVSMATAETARFHRQVAAAQSNITDTVKKIREDDEGIAILFQKNAGSYYLRRDVAEFDSAKKKLQDSLSSKKPVSVTLDSKQLNILEVK